MQNSSVLQLSSIPQPWWPQVMLKISQYSTIKGMLQLLFLYIITSKYNKFLTSLRSIFSNHIRARVTFISLPSSLGKTFASTVERHPFFRKQCFSLKYVLVAPPSIFLEVCLNSEHMWKWSQVYNFNCARAGFEVTSTLPNSDTL